MLVPKILFSRGGMLTGSSVCQTSIPKFHIHFPARRPAQALPVLPSKKEFSSGREISKREYDITMVKINIILKDFGLV